MKTYKAEILSIGEWRWYKASDIGAAQVLAEEEFGEDDIGRIIEVRV